MLTGSLYQQLTHVAESRNQSPCETHEQFQGFRPFVSATDPWGNKLTYECVEGELRVVSAGPDQVLHTEDDIVNGRLADQMRASKAKAAGSKPSATVEPTDGRAKKKKHVGFALLALIGAIVVTVVVRDANS